MMRKWGMLLFIFNLFCINYSAFSENRIVNLVVSYKTVSFTGKKITAIAVNNQIPAPTLHFKEGDHVVINVTNALKEGTAIHWHGILVPWQMDGVDGVTQNPIPPGKTFHYRFTLEQSGTYWYHAHAGLQEQQGLYGAFIVDPKTTADYHYDVDKVVVLSDWSNTHPESILSNLKKSGDYYAPNMPLQPSLVRFLHDYANASPSVRKQLWSDYLSMQKSRMSIFDFSDIAYDAFLMNGHSQLDPWQAIAKPGNVVRLRFIDAGASTNFNVKIPNHVMTVINADGNNIKPLQVNQFLITPGETQDVLIRMNTHPAIIYAESADTIGAAVGALVTHQQQSVPYQSVKPFPKPIPVTQEMMHNMMQSQGHQMHENNMTMDMKTEPEIIGDHLEKQSHSLLKIRTSGTKYQNFVADVKTNNPNKPIYRVLHMELFGYMHHFIWMINGLPEYKAKPIPLIEGKRYRLIFTNNSMMHHPMHIHGHWFILRNGHGSYDPLLHTIDVAPGATVVADIDADASGQWFFHCHHLYHMMTGMSRIFQYQSIISVEKGLMKPQRVIKQTQYINRPIIRVDEALPLIPMLISHPMGHGAMFFASNYLDVGADFWNNTQEITYNGMYGSDYNKLKLYAENAKIEKGDLSDFNLDIFYWHLISQFWEIEMGVNYVNEPAFHPYWQPGFGIEGLMPFFIDTSLRMYVYAGSVKFDLELSRDTQITNNFFIRTGIESIFATSAVAGAPIASGLNEMQYTIRPYYRVAPGWDVFCQYQYTKSYGLLANFSRSHGDEPSDHLFTVGAAVLF